jgi:hypothetical protein
VGPLDAATLTPQTRSLLGEGLVGGGMVYLNRLVLEEAFTDAIAGPLRRARFVRVNAFLAEYAAPGLNPLGQLTPVADPGQRDRAVLTQILGELDPLVNGYILHQLSLPAGAVSWGGADTGSRDTVRAQAATDGHQEFWAMFLKSLSARRAVGKRLEITAGKFLYQRVRWALGQRGRRAIVVLNESLDDFHHRRTDEFLLFDALLRCCEDELARERDGHDNLTEDDRAVISKAAQRLLDWVIDGIILQIATLPRPTYDGELEGLTMMGAAGSPCYVDMGRFRELFGLARAGHERPEPDGPADDVPSLEQASPGAFDEGRRNAVRRIILNACDDLASREGEASQRTALRDLLVVTFLPYYEREGDFGRDFELAAGTVQLGKQRWAETLIGQMATGVADDPDWTDRLAKATRKHGRFGPIVADPHVFDWLECGDEARAALWRDPGVGCRALSALYHYACGECRRFRRVGGFFVQEAKNGPPDGLLSYGGEHPSTGLRLCWSAAAKEKGS